MDLDQLIKKLFKNLDSLLPILIIGFAVLSPIIKAVLEKRKSAAQGGRRTGREKVEKEQEEEQREFFPEWEEQLPREEAPPPAPPPPVPPEPVFVSAPQKTKKFVPIEEESQDVVEEAQHLALDAESVASLNVQAPVLEAQMKKEEAAVVAVVPSAPKINVSANDPFAGWSPFQIAVVLGSSMDRPAAFREFEEVGPVGLR